MIMLPRGWLVSLSGIDGAGKSTVACQLGELLLSDYSIVSRYVWCKFGDHPLRHFGLSKFGGRRQANRLHSSHNGGKQPYAVFTVYGMVLLAFHLAHIIFAVRRPVRRGQVVICDRYIFDTMVDLQQDLHFPMFRMRSILGAQWIPQPDCRFLLDLEEEVAFARKADTASVQYLQERRAIYSDIAREYGLTVIDASQPIETVTRLVMEQLKTADFPGKGVS